jgi:putative NADPH-quinone reductase
VRIPGAVRPSGRDGFVAALHAKVVEVLRAKWHKVDDCDLYAGGFDPVMSRQDRIDYHNLAVNRRKVAPYVDRLLAAEALVFSFQSGT